MTEVETIAGSTPNGVKPGSTDENPGAPDMSRVPATPVPGVAPQPSFGATDPAAVAAAPVPGGINTPTPGPFTPTPVDADPTKTVELSSSGADKTAQQDKDSDQARKDEADLPPAKDRDTGPDFAGIKERSRADAENRQRDLKEQAADPKNNAPRSNETDTIVPGAGSASGGALTSNSSGIGPDTAGGPNPNYAAPVDNAGRGYQEPEPAVGRIVLYSLTQADADRINTRRVYGPKGDDMSALEEGASVQAGVQYPAMITSVGDQVVNLHVFADGNHGVWVKDAKRGTDGGSWAWPVIKR